MRGTYIGASHLCSDEGTAAHAESVPTVSGRQAAAPTPVPPTPLVRSRRFSKVPGLVLIPGVTVRPDHGLESDTVPGVYNTRQLQHLDLADLQRMADNGGLSEWADGVSQSKPRVPRAHVPSRGRMHVPDPPPSADPEDPEMTELLAQVRAVLVALNLCHTCRTCGLHTPSCA